MLKDSQQSELDEIDKALLNIVQADGHLTNVELARRVNLSPPATHARIKRLEQLGYISQYTAIIDRYKIGYDLLGFIQISIQAHQFELFEKFQHFMQELPEVLECYRITGEYDYLLKVVLHNGQDLSQFVGERLPPIMGINRIHTSLVLTEVKSTTILPVE
jgi:Lrp/AsnC family leucine-responsive transcriptional regulator